MEFPRELIDRLASAQSIAVLTGAGISAESGVPTFRSKDGIWSKMKPEEMASIEGFMRNPKLVWEWYQHRRSIIQNVKPNPGHFALAQLEKAIPDFTLATQNVDNLHTLAGSQRVLELHGNITRNHCLDCRKEFFKKDFENFHPQEGVPCCSCGGYLRPGVVWFGEMLPMDTLAEAEAAARSCQVFLSIGTSAVVYPAAGLPILAKQSGACLIEINPEETPITDITDYSLLGASGQILPLLLDQFLSKKSST